MSRFKLLLTSLKFVSSVDTPAQETAQALLLKRGPNAPLVVKTTAKVLKVSDELGLVFGWALTTKVNGVEYYDLHGDNIVEDDLIKIAADWMTASGGAADTMHDRVKDGRAVFCMPMTSEVAKAFFGAKFDAAIGTYGLMVAIKPSAEDFAKFKSGELAGFSIDGTGIREAVKTSKAALFTTEVDGHQHTVDLMGAGDDGCNWYTSYQNAAGADMGHSHAIVRNADGTITILADSGHTHELSGDSPAVVVVPENAVIVVENKAPVASAQTPTLAKSTPPAASPKVEPMKLVVLTEAQHAHYQKLAPADAEAFVAKSAAERDTDIEKAKQADPVVYKTASGIEIRKSHGDIAVMLAKQADESAAQVAKATELATAEKSARELVELTKRADTMLAVVKADDGGHVALLRAVESIGDEKQRAAATKALQTLANTTRLGKSAAGVTGEDPNAEVIIETEQGPAMDALEKGLLAFCEKNKITKNVWTDGLAKFARTPEGAALKKAVTESTAG